MTEKDCEPKKRCNFSKVMDGLLTHVERDDTELFLTGIITMVCSLAEDPAAVVVTLKSIDAKYGKAGCDIFQKFMLSFTCCDGKEVSEALDQFLKIAREQKEILKKESGK